MASWGTLKEDCPFAEIFPERRVEIRSIVPIIPREQGSPPCYVVKGEALSQEQLKKLANRLYEIWQPECESVGAAAEYILEGLPLKTTHFSSVTTDDYFQVPVGVALNIAIRSAYEDDVSKL
jgi:hypothetical protein